MSNSSWTTCWIQTTSCAYLFFFLWWTQLVCEDWGGGVEERHWHWRRRRRRKKNLLLQSETFSGLKLRVLALLILFSFPLFYFFKPPAFASSHKSVRRGTRCHLLATKVGKRPPPPFVDSSRVVCFDRLIYLFSFFFLSNEREREREIIINEKMF